MIGIFSLNNSNYLITHYVKKLFSIIKMITLSTQFNDQIVYKWTIFLLYGKIVMIVEFPSPQE
jgi:hypothetical protein